jgi:hypothetical protein
VKAYNDSKTRPWIVNFGEICLLILMDISFLTGRQAWACSMFEYLECWWEGGESKQFKVRKDTLMKIAQESIDKDAKNVEALISVKNKKLNLTI